MLTLTNESEVKPMSEALDVVLRQPNDEDALAISKLFVDRYNDIVPGFQSWKAKRIRYLQTHGEGYFLNKIHDATHFEAGYFACVATVDSELAGFAYAEADKGNNQFARLVGLVVDRAYEHKGIGSQLEKKRQEWALAQRRILYGKLVYEGEGAWDFYRKNGYREIDTWGEDQTTFRLIAHPLPDTPLVTTTIHWQVPRDDQEPLVY